MGDYAKVIQGAKMVMDQAIKRNGPEMQRRLERSLYHLSELLKLVNETVSSHQQRRHPTVSDTNTGAQSATRHAQAHQEEFTYHNDTRQTYDPIGFDNIARNKENIKIEVGTKEPEKDVQKNMRARAVPSTQIGRMVGFGSLALKLAVGEAMDKASYVFTGSRVERSMSDESAERLAEALCRMRGAALKLGQMLSIQDDASLPPSLSKALDRVKQAADYMPQHQLENQLGNHLGSNWRSYFAEFDPLPLAAASIGQVHRAVLKDNDATVAVKIQYPGVAESIESDLENLKRLVNLTGLVPPGLFVDNIIAVARRELQEECDYITEAKSQIRYRELISTDPLLSKHTNVPQVFSELSSSRVLVTRLVPGVPIDKATKYPEAVRNAIARTVLLLTIRELFDWRFIQSDPNFANFLYDHDSLTIHLIDFGAARSYSKTFVDGYMKLVWAAANRDRETILSVSKELGFLTGDESAEFVDAHVEAGLVVGEPFVSNEPFDFANSELTQRIGKYGGTFMKYRLTPPPTEAYSLHRKLAGAFLLCIKLKAKISCRDMLEETYKRYKFD